MEMLNQDTLKKLLKKRNEPSISIYIPTHRKGDESEQDHIRFKNQIREVEKQLVEKGYKKNESDNLLNPLKQLLYQKVYLQ